MKAGGDEKMCGRAFDDVYWGFTRFKEFSH